MSAPACACFKCREPLVADDFASGRAFRIGSLDACGGCVGSLVARLTKEQRRNLLAKNPALANPRPLTPRRRSGLPSSPPHRGPLAPEAEAAVAEAQAILTPPEALPAQGRGHTTTDILRLVGPLDTAAPPMPSRKAVLAGAATPRTRGRSPSRRPAATSNRPPRRPSPP